MEYNSYLQKCGDDDVISFGSGLYKIGKVKPGFASSIAKVADAIIESLEAYGITDAHMYEVPNRGAAYKVNRKWFQEGKDCEILRIGAKGWQKGKIRLKLTVEFIADEPEFPERPASDESEILQTESPLDEIRKIRHQENKQ